MTIARCARGGIVGVLLVLGALVGVAVGQELDAPASNRTADAGSGSVELRQAWDAAPRVTCVVCRVRPGLIQHSELHRGTLVPVCSYCVGIYRSNPAPYFAEFQPRAALFQDEYAVRSPVNWWVFGLGCYAVLGLLCAGIAGHTALKRGHPPWPAIVRGLFGTVAGVAWVRMLPQRELTFGLQGVGKVSTTYPPTACDACGAPTHPAATACAKCGQALTASVPSEATTTLPS